MSEPSQVSFQTEVGLYTTVPAGGMKRSQRQTRRVTSGPGPSHRGQAAPPRRQADPCQRQAASTLHPTTGTSNNFRGRGRGRGRGSQGHRGGGSGRSSPTARSDVSLRTTLGNSPGVRTRSSPFAKTSRFEAELTRISKDDRRWTSNRPWTPNTPSGTQAPRGLRTYRLSNLEFTLHKAEINTSLRNFANEGTRGGKDPQIRSCAPATVDRQTVVVTFKQPPWLDNEDEPQRLPELKTTGQLIPEIDQNFGGITPLSSPWDDRRTLKRAAESESKWASYLSCLVSLFHSSTPWPPPLPVKLDILILTPPGEHPFEFWKSGVNDLVFEPMWVVDHLPNEGFDGARISVFRIDETSDNPAQECLDKLAEYVQKSQLKSDHLVFVVEFLRRDIDGESVAREMCRLQHKNTKGPKPLDAQFRAIVFDELDHQPGKSLPPSAPYCTDGFWLSSASSDREPLRFSGNDSDIYRRLVDSIWTNLGQIYEAQSPKTQLSQPAAVIDAPLLAELNELIKPLNTFSTQSIKKTKGDGGGRLDDDGKLYAIIHDQEFAAWRDPGPGLNALQICGSQDLNLGELCERLPRFPEGYDVLRIDCGALGQECKKMEGYGKANSLVGPFLLKIFQFVVDSWAGKCANAADQGAMATVAINSLALGIIDAGGPGSSARSHMASLVYGIERLGSNIVQVVFRALQLGQQNQPSAVSQARSMILLAGLHGFEESPELGRLVHCVRQLHQMIIDLGGVCKVLFTHEHCEHLKGLLHDVRVIDGDSELRACRLSLQCTDSRERKKTDERYTGTLEWLQEDDAFKRWRDEDGSALLLLLGKPASGKSVLSKFAIDELRGASQRNGLSGPGPKEAAVATLFFTTFFFHADGPDELNTSTAMLRELLYKMLHENPSFFPHFQPHFREVKRRAQEQGGFPTWQERDLMAVVEALQGYGLRARIVALVDGLDESHDRLRCAEVLAELVGMRKGGHISVKLLVATRQDNPTQRALTTPLSKQGILPGTITIQNKNRTDITDYSRSVLADTRTVGWNETTIDKAARIMADMSDGIFLWPKLAKTLMDDFLDGRKDASMDELKTFLGKTNPDIESLYQRLLDRLLQGPLNDRMVDGSSARESLRMFHMAMQAARDLSLDEFRDVYFLKSNPDPRCANMDDLRGTNITRVVSNNTSNFLEVDKKRDTVHFVHSTARHYLRTKLLQDYGTQSAGLQPSGPIGNGELSIMEHACLWYLQKAFTHLEQETAGIPWETQKPTAPSPAQKPLVEAMNSFAKVINDYPLLAYVFEHGSSHLSHDKPGLVEAMRRLLESLGENPMRFLLPEWMRTRLPAPPTPEDSRAFRDAVLHCAALRCWVTAARVALAAGADFESQSKLHRSGEIPMCLAIMASRHEKPEAVCKVVQVLLEKSASANATTRWDGTPLHYAGKYMLEGVVEQLLAQDAFVDARDFKGMTPLHRTVIGLSARRPALDLGDGDEGGEGDDGYVDEYEGDGDPNNNKDARLGNPNSDSREQQLQIRANGNLEREVSIPCVKRLLKHGADPRAADKWGRKPIHLAAGQRDGTETVKVLLEAVRRRDVDRGQAAEERCTENGSTPLQWASRHGNIEVVNFLLKQGAKAGTTDYHGRTAISLAARFGHDEVLAALLNSVPNEDRKTIVNKQETASERHALIWACFEGRMKCVELLIRAGANVNLPERGYGDVSGTALSWAITIRHKPIVKLLVSKGATCDEGDGRRPALGWAAAIGDVDLFDTVYYTSKNNGYWPTLSQADAKGCTPFMLAAAHGHLKMAKYLHEVHKVFLFGQDVERNLALHLAAGWGHLDVVEWLVKVVKMDINWTNNKGETALHRAARYGRSEVIGFLLQQKAMDIRENDEGKTYQDLEDEYQYRNQQMALGTGNHNNNTSSGT